MKAGLWFMTSFSTCLSCSVRDSFLKPVQVAKFFMVRQLRVRARGVPFGGDASRGRWDSFLRFEGG